MFVLNILLFLLVLSILVAVHEFGHFIAAKACNIYVDRFSVGMPPRLFGFKYGETDYCIGALPIGGYVKMAGQEDAPLSDEERELEYGHVAPERFFNNKPVWQRAIVLVAGPAMNLVLAVLLYGIYAGAGKEVPESELIARVGRVMENAPAASAPLYYEARGTDGAAISGEPDAFGWQTGDYLISVDGQPLENIHRLAIAAIINGENHTHRIVIERELDGGERVRFISPIKPERLEEDDPYPLFGVSSYETPVVTEVLPDRPAAAAGLEKDDVILAVNGQLVDRQTFIETISRTGEGETHTLSIERGETIIEKQLAPESAGRFAGLVYTSAGGLDAPDSQPVIAMVEPELSELSGLQAGDTIVAVNGAPMSYAALQVLEKESAGTSIQLSIERPAKLFGLRAPALTLDVAAPVDEIRWIGVTLAPRMVYHRIPASQIVPEAFSRSYEATALTLSTLSALVQRNVSPKDLGGPVMIYEVTTKAAEIGWLWLIRIMAFISINLAIFNMLPLPVLDGGQLLLNGIEAIRRKPLNPVFVERYQQAGLLLIISLMLFVTWNDIGRLIGNS